MMSARIWLGTASLLACLGGSGADAGLLAAAGAESPAGFEAKAAAGAGRMRGMLVDVRPVLAAAKVRPAMQGLADLHLEVVLSGAGVNGNRLDLDRFVDARSLETLRDEVRRNWSRRPGPIHSSTRDGWFVLMQVDGPSIEMVELRPLGDATEGRWSRLRKGYGQVGETSAWLEAALPAGSQVLDRVEHDDDGRRMTTMVATTPAAATSTLDRLVAMLERSGFTVRSRSAPSFAGKGHALFLMRGSEDIALTISEHEGRRAVVLHWGRTAP